jgi:asparagine synthetase B (glutamine-hydrolysing)
MVHKRLSIVAPGPDGDQPLYTDASHDTTFICNGEIYNHEVRHTTRHAQLSVHSCVLTTLPPLYATRVREFSVS